MKWNTMAWTQGREVRVISSVSVVVGVHEIVVNDDGCARSNEFGAPRRRNETSSLEYRDA